MKRILLLLILIPFFLTLMIHSYPVEGKANTIVLSELAVDLTGDGKNDKVTVKGVKAGWKKYERLILEVDGSNQKHYKVKLGNGSKPDLQFLDFNHDGITDLYTRSKITGKELKNVQNLFTVKTSKMAKIKLPEPLFIESGFLNGYKAMIKINNTGDNYLLDLKDRKKFYEKLGLFYKNKLNEPTELMVDTYSDLNPVLISEKKAGLKGIQPVWGASNTDKVAYVESLWSYSHSKWKLMKVKVYKYKY